ncbi:MAG: hypothetical protein ACI4DY_09580 [Monoglobaceae bacterium]
MRVCVNPDLKIIQFWVTQSEREDEEFSTKLRSAASLSGCEKFKRIIYISGEQSLQDLTYDIIKRNRYLPKKPAPCR